MILLLAVLVLLILAEAVAFHVLDQRRSRLTEQIRGGGTRFELPRGQERLPL